MAHQAAAHYRAVPARRRIDVISRILSAKLTGSLGQTVIVDNRPGAGSNIGSGIAAKAPADGYSLLTVSFAFTVNPTLFANPPEDFTAPVKADFVRWDTVIREGGIKVD